MDDVCQNRTIYLNLYTLCNYRKIKKHQHLWTFTKK